MTTCPQVPDEGRVMTGTERKRAWRLAHPEQSATAERTRARARRTGYWTELTAGSGKDDRRPCTSSASYWRYERSPDRMEQRMWWPKYGAGAHKLSYEEFQERIAVYLQEKIATIIGPSGRAAR